MGFSDKEEVGEAVRRSWLRRNYGYIVAFVGAIAVIFVALHFGARFQQFEGYGYPGIFLTALLGSTVPIWPVPGALASFIGGGLHWNPFFIALAAGTGEAIGELTYYSIGYSGRGVMEKAKKWRLYNKFDDLMRRRGSITLFLVSVVPNPFIRFADVAAGAMRFPLRKFFPIVWTGKFIKSLAFAFAGAGILPWFTNIIQRVWG